MEKNPEEQKFRFSVSQINTFKRCEHKWWREKGIHGPKVRSPGSPSTRLGSKVHHHLENFLEEGTIPPDDKAGRIAKSGLKHLPDPEDIKVEESILLPITENANMLCRIDMMGTSSPYIGDHKTTKNFKWAKTVQEIEHDTQLLAYAYAAYKETRPEKVKLEFIYYLTSGMPVSMSISDEVDWETIENKWKELEVITTDMAEKIVDPTGENCKGNTSACNDYGGCFHAKECPFSPKNKNSLFTKGFNSDNNISTAITVEKEKKMKNTEDIKNGLGFSITSKPLGSQEEMNLQDLTFKIKTLKEMLGDKIKPELIEELINNSDISPSFKKIILSKQGLSKDIEDQQVASLEPILPPPVVKKPVPMLKSGGTTDVHLRAIGNLLAGKIQKAGNKGYSLIDAKEWAQAQITRNLTEKRWNKILTYSGLDPWGNSSQGMWLIAPSEGHTEEPEEPVPSFSQDAKSSGTPEVAEAREKQVEVYQETVDRATAIASMIVEPAIIQNLVVFLDCLPSSYSALKVVTLDQYLKPFVERIEKRSRKKIWELDLHFGDGKKMLTGELQTTLDPNKGSVVIHISSLHPYAGIAVSALTEAGALIIRGCR